VRSIIHLTFSEFRAPSSELINAVSTLMMTYTIHILILLERRRSEFRLIELLLELMRICSAIPACSIRIHSLALFFGIRQDKLDLKKSRRTPGPQHQGEPKTSYQTPCKLCIEWLGTRSH
jgi:hypothetical protein